MLNSWRTVAAFLLGVVTVGLVHFHAETWLMAVTFLAAPWSIAIEALPDIAEFYQQVKATIKSKGPISKGIPLMSKEQL